MHAIHQKFPQQRKMQISDGRKSSRFMVVTSLLDVEFIFWLIMLSCADSTLQYSFSANILVGNSLNEAWVNAQHFTTAEISARAQKIMKEISKIDQKVVIILQ